MFVDASIHLNLPKGIHQVVYRMKIGLQEQVVKEESLW